MAGQKIGSVCQQSLGRNPAAALKLQERNGWIGMVKAFGSGQTLPGGSLGKCIAARKVFVHRQVAVQEQEMDQPDQGDLQ